MKSIALIHTVKTVANSFEQKLKDYVGEPVKIHNLWDDFLANNPNEIGEFTIENRCRLYNDIKSAEMTGADMIVVTCSTLTPVVNMIRPFVRVPLIAIDDAIGKEGSNLRRTDPGSCDGRKHGGAYAGKAECGSSKAWKKHSD